MQLNLLLGLWGFPPGYAQVVLTKKLPDVKYRKWMGVIGQGPSRQSFYGSSSIFGSAVFSPSEQGTKTTYVISEFICVMIFNVLLESFNSDIWVVTYLLYEIKMLPWDLVALRSPVFQFAVFVYALYDIDLVLDVQNLFLLSSPVTPVWSHQYLQVFYIVLF